MQSPQNESTPRRLTLDGHAGICLIWRPLSENYTNTKTLLYARLIFDQPFSLKEFKGKWEQRPFFRQDEESQIHSKGQFFFAFRRLVT